jgi:hypothetical protein
VLHAIQIAFADQNFPPPASPGMQEAWRTMRHSHGANRPALSALDPSAKDAALADASQDHILPFPDEDLIEAAE